MKSNVRPVHALNHGKNADNPQVNAVVEAFICSLFNLNFSDDIEEQVSNKFDAIIEDAAEFAN